MSLTCFDLRISISPCLINWYIIVRLIPVRLQAGSILVFKVAQSHHIPILGSSVVSVMIDRVLAKVSFQHSGQLGGRCKIEVSPDTE